MIYDGLEYKRAKKKVTDLKKFLFQLDTIGEILYNNLDKDDIWDLINKFEDVNIKHYLEFHEYDEILRNKGNVDVK